MGSQKQKKGGRFVGSRGTCPSKQRPSPVKERTKGGYLTEEKGKTPFKKGTSLKIIWKNKILLWKLGKKGPKKLVLGKDP